MLGPDTPIPRLQEPQPCSSLEAELDIRRGAEGKPLEGTPVSLGKQWVLKGGGGGR